MPFNEIIIKINVEHRSIIYRAFEPMTFTVVGSFFIGGKNEYIRN